MANLVACADGNLTSSTSWALVDSTSFLNSQAANTALSTSFLNSQSFTPGAITVDAVGVKLASNASAWTGTVTVELQQAGVTVPGTSVTIDVAELPAASTSNASGGWILFKFAAPVTLAAATPYTVAALKTGSNSVALYRNATSSNWTRFLRTTTTQAPVAGDNMIICAERAGVGAVTSRTITMDSTTNTDYGDGTASVVAIAIGAGGTLKFATAASTNYVLRLSGFIVVYAGGTLNVGTLADPIPRSSTAWIEFDCPSNLSFGINVRGTGSYTHCGQSRTAGKDVSVCKLTADAAAGSTSLSVSEDTGWLDNDQIVLYSTDTNKAHAEDGTLNGAAGAATLTIDGFAGVGGGLAFLHTGSDPVYGEVILLTRNTGVRTVGAGAAYISFENSTTFSFSWAAFANLGASSTVGIGASTSGSFTINHCVMYSYQSAGFTCNIQTSGGSSISYFCFYSRSGSSSAAFSSTNNTVIDNVYASYNGSGSLISLYLNDSASITNVYGVGSSLYAVQLGARSSGTIANIYGRCSSSANIVFQNGHYNGATITNIQAHRSSSSVGAGISGTMYSGTINGVYVTSSGFYHFDVGGTLFANNVVWGDDGYQSTNYGLYLGGATVKIDGGSFGQSPLTKTTSGTVVINNGGGAKVYINNVLTNETDIPSVNNRDAWTRAATVAFSRRNQVDGAYITYGCNETVERDSTIYYTSPPSEKVSPLFLSRIGVSQSRFIPVDAGQARNVSVVVRKSATYNGTAPRLILVANDAVGVTADVVLATMTGGAEAWETLSGTTPVATDTGAFEVLVDCTGSAGYINIDDWSVI